MGHGAYVRKPNEIDFGIHWGRIEQHAERNVLPVGLEAAPELVRANKHVRLLRVLQHARARADCGIAAKDVVLVRHTTLNLRASDGLDRGAARNDGTCRSSPCAAARTPGLRPGTSC